MRFNGLRWPLLLAVSIASAPGADKEKSKFEVKPAASYRHHQTSEKVTIAAEPMETDDETRKAFGKINPWRYGVLPVLIVIQNDGPNAIRVDRIKLVYTLPDNTRVEATPPQDVRFIHGTRAPRGLPGPTGGIRITRPPKNPSPSGKSKEGRLPQRWFQPVNPPAALSIFRSHRAARPLPFWYRVWKIR